MNTSGEPIPDSLRAILGLPGVKIACYDDEEQHLEVRVHSDFQEHPAGPFGLFKRQVTRYIIEYCHYQPWSGWQYFFDKTEAERDTLLKEFFHLPLDQGWTIRERSFL